MRWMTSTARRLACHLAYWYGVRVRALANRGRKGQPLRIAFVGGRGVGSAYSGIERYYEEMGARLARQGHRVLVYCRSHFSPKVPTFRGMEIVRIPTVRFKHFETLVHSFLATIDVCFRQIDIVQFHALGSSPLAFIPRLVGKKTVVSVRGLDWQRGKWGVLARRYLRFCEMTSVYCPNATVVVSRTLKQHYAQRFRRPVRYIPNGVRKPDLLPPESIFGFGLTPRSYFLYAGRLSPEKGLEVLIEAHKRIDSGCRLAIAGGSSYSEAYIDRLRSQAGPDVVFTGFLTGPPLEELYANAKAFVLPSRMEGLSIALLEAMTFGLPVVASDIPENRELVDECGGFLFRVDDVDDLARALRRVVADPESALRVGCGARETVRARFDWDVIAQETGRFYQVLVGGASPKEADTTAAAEVT